MVNLNSIIETQIRENPALRTQVLDLWQLAIMEYSTNKEDHARVDEFANLLESWWENPQAENINFQEALRVPGYEIHLAILLEIGDLIDWTSLARTFDAIFLHNCQQDQDA